MVQSGPRGLSVAARAAGQRLGGQYGAQPAALDWTSLAVRTGVDGALRADVGGLRLALGTSGTGQTIAAKEAHYTGGRFAAGDVSYRNASSSGQTRAQIGTIAGSVDANGHATGTVSGINGALANIPLALDEGAGRFVYDGTALTLNGDARIAYDGGTSVVGDEPIFRPVRLTQFALRFADNVVTVNGPMLLEENGRKVATLDLSHNMQVGAGRARFLVDSLRFDEDLQPAQLFPATYGTISAVRGEVDGDAFIEWDDKGVRSGGTFDVANTDLAAAFGPVTGLSGTIRFTDLLALETAPGQTFRIASVNPGIEVFDGVVRFQMLSDLRARVEEGEWPFAGGKLILRPTIIDLNSQEPRYLSFFIEGLDAAAFLREMEYDNVTATGIFDGELPMVFDLNGGRVDNGTLLSRPGGGTLAYVGELSYEDMGTFANYAFDMLKSIAYNRLEIIMNGQIDGEILTQIQFSGLQQGEGAQRNIVTRQLAKLPIQFNINISAPFMQLLGTLRGLNDPKLMVGRNLDALLAEQKRLRASETGGQPSGAVQAAESEPMVEGKVEK